MIGHVETRDVHSVRILQCAPDGPNLASEAAARDLIGEAAGAGAEWIVIPAERLGDAFFDLKTRIAGEMLQKIVNYRVGVAIIGDLSTRAAVSDALRDFMCESNRGRTVWFVDNVAAFEDRLAAHAS